MADIVGKRPLMISDATRNGKAGRLRGRLCGTAVALERMELEAASHRWQPHATARQGGVDGLMEASANLNGWSAAGRMDFKRGI